MFLNFCFRFQHSDQRDVELLPGDRPVQLVRRRGNAGHAAAERRQANDVALSAVRRR